jgi:hypothetical protein
MRQGVREILFAECRPNLSNLDVLLDEKLYKTGGGFTTGVISASFAYPVYH